MDGRGSERGGSEAEGTMPEAGDRVLLGAQKKDGLRGHPFFVFGTREDSKRRGGASTASANRQDAGLAAEAA